MSSPPTSPDSYICHSFSDELETSDSSFLNSLNHSHEESEHFQANKLLEFNREMANANLAFKNFFISKLILNTYKALTGKNARNAQVSQEAVECVKDAMLAGNLQNCIKMKSRNGKSFDLLGLSDDVTERKCNLSALEHSRLKIKILNDLEKKTEELKDKKTTIKKVFYEHSHQQVVDQEGILHERKLEKYLESHNNLTKKFDVLALQLRENSEMMDQLLYYQQYNYSQKQCIMSFRTVITKVKFLNCFTSIMKECVERFLRENKSYIKYLNTNGRELEKSVNSLKKRETYLKGIFHKYSQKEKHSVVFRELVKEYNKTKKDLQSKTLTLNILDMPDDEASFNKP